jgi:glycosyltransferase involved in cell wall biosynthesis
MRVAYISHFYPPTHNAGIEQNTHALATGMLAAGHSVKVLCVNNWTEGDPYWQGQSEDEWEGVPVRRLNVNWKRAANPNANLYDNPFLAERTREFLEDFDPDIVHIASLYTLSMRILEVIRALGLPSVMTLSDFWLVCPRLTLVRHDGGICDGQVSASTCQDCLLRGSPAYRLVRRVSPQPLLDSICGSVIRRPSLAASTPGLRGFGMDVRGRRKVIQRYLPYIDRMVAPSRYVADVIQSCGLEMNVEISHHGNRLNWLPEYADRPADGELHFGYMGQIRPHKGLHLLIQGFRANRFPSQVKLFIYGNLDDDPEYVAKLRGLAGQDPNIHFEGSFKRAELPRVLKNIDALVVPSTWPEVAGLVVQEAFAAHKPVLASNMGGLPEFVRPGEGGLLFDVKDHTGVQRALAEVHSGGSEYLAKLRSATPPVRTVADEQVHLQAIYQRLIDARSRGAGGGDGLPESSTPSRRPAMAP